MTSCSLPVSQLCIKGARVRTLAPVRAGHATQITYALHIKRGELFTAAFSDRFYMVYALQGMFWSMPSF